MFGCILNFLTISKTFSKLPYSNVSKNMKRMHLVCMDVMEVETLEFMDSLEIREEGGTPYLFHSEKRKEEGGG